MDQLHNIHSWKFFRERKKNEIKPTGYLENWHWMEPYQN